MLFLYHELMDCKSAIQYLNNTPSSLWDFKVVVGIIKAKNGCSNDKAFSALNNILKKNFDAAQTSFFITNWKSLISNFEKQREDPIRQTIQTQTNIDIGSVNTINNKNTNIIKRKRKLINRESFTSERRRKTFDEIFDESNEDSDTGSGFHMANDNDASSPIVADLPQVMDIDITHDLLSSLKARSTYHFEGEDIDFAEYKLACLHHLDKQGQVFLEPNFAEVIALSHCVLLKHGCYSETMINFFTLEKLENIHDSLKASYFGAQQDPLYNFSTAFIQKVENTLKGLSARNEDMIYTEIEGCKSLANTYLDKQLLKMVLELLEFLPKYPQPNVNEENLRVKCFNPSIKYFMNCKKFGITLTYPETSPDERKPRTDAIKRPDAIASFYEQVKTTHNGAFFEIKNDSYKSRKRILMVDLLKLVHYGKDALDAGVKTPILAQVIGFDVTFYLMKLESKGVYIMLEVCHVKLPSTIFEINAYLREMDKVQKLINILVANKEKELMREVNEKKMASYGTPRVERMVEQLTYKHSTDFFF
ncbi:3',5'-cyclic-nucleotide phosphodiesterase (PDEase) (3':5'-CNP) [Mucor velutinosus]|uniref:3',5'-cyclic-nucleotide phosphodiesterase (PDEase) (3':5'-CNP) n=1 Tax=Mucor velutinosus TaxID=708070 RepID=A0AAN7DKR1_9FUNG|nr:3',5'-cyclic-nucleotide phosphodiesterase (PDEase) (3':5'-CNP) [Mucor velutinosus]